MADVVIGKTNGNWYLDIGYDLRSAQRNEYMLNESQLAAVKEGTFKVLVVKDGATHRLYAQNGENFELAAIYVDDDDTMVSFNSIDLLVHNNAGGGSGEFGMKRTRVYANYDEDVTASELIAGIADAPIQLKPHVDSPDATVEGLENYYAIGDKCMGCGQCAETCPAVCISPAPGHRAIKRVHIDESKCIGCSLCKRNCPAAAVEGVIKNPFRIIESRCIRCGACAVKCKPQAVIIEYAEA